MERAITIYQGDEPLSLDNCIAGWLHEKEHLSGSRMTADAYRDTLMTFRAALQEQQYDLDSRPRDVALAAQSWCGHSKINANVAPATYNQRRSILSSFYEYAIRHEVLEHNPIARVLAVKQQGKKDAARPLEPPFVKERLSLIDCATPEGKRDYALLSVALTTARRVSELAGLRYKHLHKQGLKCVVEWEHCKGNKYMQDVLPAKTTQSLYGYLHAVYGAALGILAPDAPIWVSFSDRNQGQAIGVRTISAIYKKHLLTGKVHTSRHTTAIRMHRQGATLQQIGKQLGHSNLKTTADYLEELLEDENPYAATLEDEFGI